MDFNQFFQGIQGTLFMVWGLSRGKSIHASALYEQSLYQAELSDLI